MTALDISSSRDYFKMRLNQIYMDLLFYLCHPLSSKPVIVQNVSELDLVMEQTNKTMFKGYKAKDYLKAVNAGQHLQQPLFLYIKLRNKERVQQQIGEFRLEFKLFRPANVVQNHLNHKKTSHPIKSNVHDLDQSPNANKMVGSLRSLESCVTTSQPRLFDRSFFKSSLESKIPKSISKTRNEMHLNGSVLKNQFKKQSKLKQNNQYNSTIKSDQLNKTESHSIQQKAIKQTMIKKTESLSKLSLEKKNAEKVQYDSVNKSFSNMNATKIDQQTEKRKDLIFNSKESHNKYVKKENLTQSTYSTSSTLVENTYFLVSSCSLPRGLLPPQWIGFELYELPLSEDVGSQTLGLELHILLSAQSLQHNNRLELFRIAQKTPVELSTLTVPNKLAPVKRITDKLPLASQTIQPADELSKLNQIQMTLRLSDLSTDRGLMVLINKFSNNRQNKTRSKPQLFWNRLLGRTRSGNLTSENELSSEGDNESEMSESDFNWNDQKLTLESQIQKTSVDLSLTSPTKKETDQTSTPSKTRWKSILWSRVLTSFGHSEKKKISPVSLNLQKRVQSVSHKKKRKLKNLVILDLELQLGAKIEYDQTRRIELMYNQIDLYIVLALEGKHELHSMNELTIHCSRWTRLYSLPSLQLLNEARLHQSLSSFEDTICRTLALGRLFARYARVRNHAFLNGCLAELLIRQWRQACYIWPRSLQKDLDDQLLEVLELLFKADMPASLLSMCRHNYSQYGHFLFQSQISLILGVVSLKRWFAHNRLFCQEMLNASAGSETGGHISGDSEREFSDSLEQSTGNDSLTTAQQQAKTEKDKNAKSSIYLRTFGGNKSQTSLYKEFKKSKKKETSKTSGVRKLNTQINSSQHHPTQQLRLCLQAQVSAIEVEFVTSLAKGFERAAKLWLKYVESERPPLNVEELVFFCSSLEQFCAGLLRVFRAPNKRFFNVTIPAPDAQNKSSTTFNQQCTAFPKIKSKTQSRKRRFSRLQRLSQKLAARVRMGHDLEPEMVKDSSQTLLDVDVEKSTTSCDPLTEPFTSMDMPPQERGEYFTQSSDGTQARFEALEYRRLRFSPTFAAPLPKPIQQTLRSIHVLIDYYLCNWIPYPLKTQIERLALPLDYAEATEQARRNAIFQATPYKDIYNSLRVAIAHLNQLHDEPLPLRISLPTIQSWFPLNVTQAWVAQEMHKIRQECAVWSDYLKDMALTTDSKYLQLKKQMFAVAIEPSRRNRYKETELSKRQSLSGLCADGKQLHLQHLVEMAEEMYENLIAFVGWPDTVFPARTARDIVYAIDLVAVVLKTWYQKLEPKRRRTFKVVYQEALQSFVEHIRTVNEQLNSNRFVDPEYRINVTKWMHHQEGCWMGVIMSLRFERSFRKKSI